jgi:hypothetical protein
MPAFGVDWPTRHAPWRKAGWLCNPTSIDAAYLL